MGSRLEPVFRFFSWRHWPIHWVEIVAHRVSSDARL